jgi:effector-binding domain-containing protein/uncharacterized protein YndB with AHSA1/START domain
MKFLKYLLIIVVLIVVVAVAYVALQPNEYNISRSKVIDVPGSMAYSAIQDLKSYEEWGPWHDEDSTIVVSYPKKSVGLGAESTWTGMEGPGKMWITEVVPNEKVALKLQFEDLEPNDMLWSIKDMGGQTEVTWTMKDDDAPFVFKMASAFSGGWDKMFGPMQEQGLQNLEDMLMEQKRKGIEFSFTTPEMTMLEAGTFIGIRQKAKMEMETMGNIFMSSLPKVSEELTKMGFSYEDFIPGAIYYTLDEEKNETDFMAGLFLINGIEKLKETDFETHQFEDEKAIKSSKFGNYGTGDFEVHTAINNTLTQQKLEAEFPIIELFVNDPAEVKPSEIQTDIYYPIKN